MNFEMHHSTWNEAGRTPVSLNEIKKWRPAISTGGLRFGVDATMKDIDGLARLCRTGGLIKNKLRKEIADKVLSSGMFPNLRMPPSTLIIADYEGVNDKPYASELCQTIRKITPNYAQYPGFIAEKAFSFGWIQRLEEYDFIPLETAFIRSETKGEWAYSLRQAMGSYYMMEMYPVADIPQELKEQGIDLATYHRWQFTAWGVLWAALRNHLPTGTKMIACIQGAYAGNQYMALEEGLRHRVVRATVDWCNGCWTWGPGDIALPIMKDFEFVAANPNHRFKGQENWGD